MEAKISFEKLVRNLQFMPCIEEIILKELCKKEKVIQEIARWFSCLMNCTIFKIGVLQYEITKMTYPDKRNDSEPFMHVSKEWKERLPEGTDVLSCHIRHGVDLSAKAVDASLHKAKKFFSEYYSNMNFSAYICSSWLLYPPMQEVLGEKSNIRSFASRFKIISASPDYRQAMERIFSYTGKTLPREKQSSLQKLALQDKGRLGYAMGIILIP